MALVWGPGQALCCSWRGSRCSRPWSHPPNRAGSRLSPMVATWLILSCGGLVSINTQGITQVQGGKVLGPQTPATHIAQALCPTQGSTRPACTAVSVGAQQ